MRVINSIVLSTVQSAIDARLDVVEGGRSNLMYCCMILTEVQNSCRARIDSQTSKMLSRPSTKWISIN
jgi:hypothetical protein